jgi:hypothetical protein
MEIDPFESEAFKKAANGLVSAALRLVGSEEALLPVLEVVSSRLLLLSSCACFISRMPSPW